MSIKTSGLIFVTALALATSMVAAPPATAAPSSAPDAPPVESAPYSDADVIEFLAVGTGPIPVDHPDLAAFIPEVDTRDLSAEEVSAIVEEVIDANPNFNEEVTERIQSGDPYETLSALEAYNDTIYELAPSNGAADGGYTGQCVVVLAVGVLVWLAVSVNTYFWGTQGAATPNTYDLAAGLAKAL
ncbi:hypothetical protein ACWIBQ_07875 [Microbacterium keratanolyticum]